MSASNESKPIKSVDSAWTDVVLVCRKCSKKLDGGFGPKQKQAFGTALSEALSAAQQDVGGRKQKARRRRTGVVEVECLDLCPKGAVVALRAGAPGDWLVIPRGTSMMDSMRQLGLNQRASTNEHVGSGQAMVDPADAPRLNP
ncbi:hypothetical protein [Lichenihabitans psoromatis]|uniref:hypothetical protein n=1 Tax=Lichenihabitans psoromatis TaxID=2528642 RepID=UPI001A9436D9|nr:hypothetical protein [Lichenihabitans psoromatis]